MNNTTRNRKRHPVTSYTTTVEDEFKLHTSSTKLETFHKYKYHGLAFFSIIVILMFTLEPLPELPIQMQYWRDNSYAISYQGNQVFFQDLRSLTPFRDQPVLVILQGYPCSSYDWRKATPYLLKVFPRIIIPDLLGTGFSDKPLDREFSYDEQAEVVELILASLKVKHVHILTQFHGEYISNSLISKQRSFNIKSLCIVNGGLPPRPVFTYLPFYDSLLFGWNYFKYTNLFGARLVRRDLYDQFLVLAHKNGYKAVVNKFKYIRESETYDFDLNRYSNSSLPVFFMYGIADQELRSHVQATNFKRHKVKVMDRVGHYPQLERPGLFVSEYLKLTKKYR